jgi:tetratricopeptide (TPR) repeat protein/tRNA A-37 threonylcarbamoyl transferase component Bud32
MKPERAALLDVIESVADGDSLDWDALEANITDEADRRMLAQLKILARIAEVHRSQPDDPSDRVIPTRGAKVIPIPIKPVLTVDEPAPLRPVASAAPVPPASIEPIGTWGPLELLERIGEGTFGEVYRARDALQREVAVKLLRADKGTADRLGEKVLREARILARIRHSNVVLVHNAETHDGRVGFWMELIRGTTLEHLLRAHGTFSAREAAFIGQDLCRALAAVHAAGLVHRDIKAQNVMREEGGRVVLMDFGAGQVAGDSAAAGRITGTPLYLAPEVLDGRDATVRSDIYSLGVLLYHLVTNDYPIRARTLDDLRLAHAENRRIRLHDARPDSLPDSLVRVIERATDPLPEKRYATAGEMQGDLVQAGGIGLPLIAPPASALTPGDATDVVAPASIGSRIRAQATRPAVLVTAALVALVATGLLVRTTWRLTATGPVIPPRTIAVLPFERGDGIEEYQAADITDGVQQILSMGSELSVISRRSTIVAAKSNLSSQEISDRLKTDELIEGRVARDGQTLHLTLRVIAAGTDASFWSAEFQAPASDPRGLQREAGLAVAKRLRVTLPVDRLASFKSLNGEQAAEAQDRYARARAFFNSGTDDGFARAATLFGEAVKIEPNYAQAYAGLARVSIAAGVNPQLPTRGHFEDAQVAATRALALDPTLAEAHAVLGQVAFMAWHWRDAEQEFKRAIQLDPSNEYASEKYAFFLAARGRPTEGIAQMIRMRAIDPLSPAAAYSTATALQYAGRYGEALIESERALQLDPTNPVAQAVHGRILAALGRFEDAKQAFAKTSGNAIGPDIMRGEIASADAGAGRRAEALAVAQAFEREFASSPDREQPELLGYLYARLGDADKAFAWLNRAVDTQPDRMLWLKVDPRVESLRRDPRFAALLARLDLQP